MVTFSFVFLFVLATIFSICLLSLRNRNNCSDGETMLVIINLRNEHNRYGELLFHYFRVIVIKWFFHK